MYILNGHFVVSMFKKVFQFGGGLVEYSGSDSVTEKINCTKRLEENLEIYVRTCSAAVCGNCHRLFVCLIDT